MTSESLNWHQPTELDEAKALLSRFPDAVVLAGGQHLIPRWEETGMPRTVVSLSQIAKLQHIDLNDGRLEIGAAVTLSQLAESKVIATAIPALASLVVEMGDRFMRNRATLGGALCATQRAGCIPAALLGTNATIHTTAGDVSACDWFRSESALPLQKGRLITGVSLQIPTVATHQYLRLISARFALITVFASKFDEGFAVGISGLADTAFRATVAERWLASGSDDDAELNRLFSEHPARTDHQSSAAYRMAQTRRLLKNAAAILRPF